MIDPLVYYYFSEEMQKEALTVGHISEAARVVGEGAKAFGHGLVGQLKAVPGLVQPGAWKRGWQALANVSPEKKKELAEFVSRQAEKGRHFRPDFHTAEGVIPALRRGGWLANVPKYEGAKQLGMFGAGEPSKLQRAKNVVMRALPGQKALTVGMSIPEAVGSLRPQEDPETGRKKGLGERVGGAAGSIGTGLIATGLPQGQGLSGAAGGMVGGMLASSVGAAGGRTAGRLLDVGTRKLKRPQKLTLPESPNR